jgi:hypothetical protein
MSNNEGNFKLFAATYLIYVKSFKIWKLEFNLKLENKLIYFIQILNWEHLK